jgi:hypothetical protein
VSSTEACPSKQNKLVKKGFRKEVIPKHTQTIHDQTFIDAMLGKAKTNLETDGFLTPVVFLYLKDGERIMCGVELPRTSKEKRQCFFNLGRTFREEGRTIREAVFMSEGWYVDARKAKDILAVAPSQHPQRQEAIVVIGRNADKMQYTSVIQPFTRDDKNRPVWGELAMAEYNAPANTAYQPTGLIDYLFSANGKEVMNHGTGQTLHREERPET